MSLAHGVELAVKALTSTPQAAQATAKFGGGYFSFPRSKYVDGAFTQSQSASYAHIYANQESVRIVVDAITRAATKRSLKCYSRADDGKKDEKSNYVAAETMRTPNDWQSQRELLASFVRDKLIFDDAFLWDMGPTDNQQRFLMRVPPYAVGVSTDNSMKPTGYTINFADGTSLNLKSYEVIHWRGYNPLHNRIGISPLETLRVVLTEESVRKAQTIDTIRGGLIKGGIVTRGMDAPEWSNKARERFQESFASRLRGTTRGEVAMLEDGMAFQDAGITPREAEMLSSRQYGLALIANMYGVNPGYFSDGGGLAQAREMMDEDVVDPLLGDLADALTTQLIRTIFDNDEHFFRFRPKKITDLSVLFEAGSKATGGSVLTPNEYREDYLDKPPIPDGDKIVSHPGSQGGGTPPAPQSAPRGRPETPAADKSIEDEEREVRQLLIKAEEDKLLELDINSKSIAKLKQSEARRAAFASIFDDAFGGNGNGSGHL